ncbi:MAG: DUF5661 family protein [Sarcina sp.]
MNLNFLKKIKYKKITRCFLKKSKFQTTSALKDSDDASFKFTNQDALKITKELGINFDKVKYSIEEFTYGMNIELEHGTTNLKTNLTNNDPLLTGKITLAHLNEFPDYYIRLQKMENAATKYWKGKKKTF